jgi:hypothetical protein
MVPGFSCAKIGELLPIFRNIAGAIIFRYLLPSTYFQPGRVFDESFFKLAHGRDQRRRHYECSAPKSGQKRTIVTKTISKVRKKSLNFVIVIDTLDRNRFLSIVGKYRT